MKVNIKIRGIFFMYGFFYCPESKLPEIKNYFVIIRFLLVVSSLILFRDRLDLEKGWY